MRITGQVLSSLYRRYVKARTDPRDCQTVAAVFLLSLVHKMRGKYIANVDDIRPQFRTEQNAFLSQNAIFNSTLTRGNGLAADATIDQFSGQRLDEVSGFKEEALPRSSHPAARHHARRPGRTRLGADDENRRRRAPDRRLRRVDHDAVTEMQGMLRNSLLSNHGRR